MNFPHWPKRFDRRVSLACACCLLLILVSFLSINLARSISKVHVSSSATANGATNSESSPAFDESITLLLKGISEQNQGRARIRTDRAVYPKPQLPVLPRAGGKFIDLTFGSEIMRATDETDGAAPGLGTYYSHWPTFNCNNTKLLIRRGDSGDAIIKDFDAVNFTVGRSAQLPQVRVGGEKVALNWESSTWSNTDPNIIYTFPLYFDGGMKLYAYNVSTKAFTLIKDFSALGGGKDYFRQMYMSADDDVFCWLQIRSGTNEGEPIYYVVYKRSTDTVLYHNPCSAYAGGVNEVHVDKSGQYLQIVVNPKPPDDTRTRFLNLKTGAIDFLRWNEKDTPAGHGDLGTGTIVGFDSFQGGISWRRLDDVHHPHLVFQFKDAAGRTDWTNDFHGTMLADNEGWITIGTYDDPSSTLLRTNVFKDEIIQVALDGSQRIRRICHTRSAYDNQTPTTGYWAAPKPNISKDGRFIAFTSNWEKSGRYDLFIVKIEPAPPLSPSEVPPAKSPQTLQQQRPRRVRSN